MFLTSRFWSQQVIVLLISILIIGAHNLLAAQIKSTIEFAQRSNNFVNSIGVAIHLGYVDTPYGRYSDLIKPRLQELGIHHIRDGAPLENTITQAKLKDLAQANILSTLVVDPREYKRASDIIRIIKLIPDTVDSFEGPNELDINEFRYKGKGFPDGLRLFQAELYRAIHTNPETAHIGVIAPSMAHPENTNKLGQVTCDFGNMHSYPGGQMPSAGGLDSHQIPAAKIMCPRKPIIATETGWHNAMSDRHSISESASAKYFPRLFLEYFNRGIYRTFIYEFIDEKLVADNPETNFGLLRYDGSPKPAFIALKNLITLLKDSGAAFDPGSLDYTLRGRLNNIHHTLLQKANGTFYLILWQEVSSAASQLNFRAATL